MKEVLMALVCMVLMSACFSPMAKPGYLSGQVVAAAYFETANVDSDRVQEIRKAAQIAYRALRAISEGATISDDQLLDLAATGLGYDSPGLRLIAADLLARGRAQLSAEVGEVTPAVVENFIAGVESAIAVYKPQVGK